MTAVWDKAIACAEEIERRFRSTGDLIETKIDESLGLYDLSFSSMRYRRAHISIVDARETKNVWMLHVTVFPHTNDPSPIYGFDIVAGPNKVSGAFHDFSASGDKDHFMLKWFANWTADLDWNKRRDLPEWAKNIFSNSMVAIGAVDEEELGYFADLGLATLNYYLDRVGNSQESGFNFYMAQNRYCRYQKQNPHTPRVLVNLGFTEQQATDFIQFNLFPELEHSPA
jgi:hypothetical protein